MRQKRGGKERTRKGDEDRNLETKMKRKKRWKRKEEAKARKKGERAGTATTTPKPSRHRPSPSPTYDADEDDGKDETDAAHAAQDRPSTRSARPDPYSRWRQYRLHPRPRPVADAERACSSSEDPPLERAWAPSNGRVHWPRRQD
jgi:hypothetical protein